MSEESFQAEVKNFLDLGFREDKDAVWWPLHRMLHQNLLKQLHALFVLHLMLDHRVQQEVHDREERAHLLVGE